MTTMSAPPRTLPLLSRVGGVFFSPGAVFASLRERPQFLGALLILMIVNLVATFLVLDVVVQDQTAALEARPDMTPEAMEKAVTGMRIATPIMAVLGNVAIVFILAGVYLFLANILLGGSTSFRGMLAAVAHVSLVAIPSSIVRVPLMLAKGTTQVPLSPAAFLSAEDGKGFLYQLLSQFDIFNLWMIGLSILAVGVIAGVPTRKAGVAICVMWAVLFPIFAFLGSKFGPGA